MVIHLTFKAVKLQHYNYRRL